MRVEDGHNHFCVSGGSYVGREIDLAADGELALAAVEFGNVKRGFFVEDQLRTADREGKCPELSHGVKDPVIAYVLL